MRKTCILGIHRLPSTHHLLWTTNKRSFQMFQKLSFKLEKCVPSLTLKTADLVVAISDRAHRSKMMILSNSWELCTCTGIGTGVLPSVFSASLCMSLSALSEPVSSLLLLVRGSKLLSLISRLWSVLCRRLKLLISSVTAILREKWIEWGNITQVSWNLQCDIFLSHANMNLKINLSKWWGLIIIHAFMYVFYTINDKGLAARKSFSGIHTLWSISNLVYFWKPKKQGTRHCCIADISQQISLPLAFPINICNCKL